MLPMLLAADAFVIAALVASVLLGAKKAARQFLCFCIGFALMTAGDLAVPRFGYAAVAVTALGLSFAFAAIYFGDESRSIPPVFKQIFGVLDKFMEARTPNE